MLLTLGICFALASHSCVDCLTCLHCTDIENPRHCKHVRDCPSGEVCHIQQTTSKYGEVIFDLGCTESSTCSNRSQGSRTCDECCSTYLCNAAVCGQPGKEDLFSYKANGTVMIAVALSVAFSGFV